MSLPIWHQHDSENWFDRIHTHATPLFGCPSSLNFPIGTALVQTSDGPRDFRLGRPPMSFPFRRILSPVDFDENSLATLEVAPQQTSSSLR